MSLFFRSRRGPVVPPADDADDVLPAHFHEPLRVWCQALLNSQNGLAERVHLRLQVERLRVPCDLLPAVRTILELGAESAVAQTGDRGWYSGTTTASWSRYRVVSLDGLRDVQWWGDQVRRLDMILLDGGSVWEVGPDGAGLQLRVNPAEDGALRTAAKAASTSPRPAGGDDLVKAWNAAYGRNPNPSEAYRLAIRAVEHAAVPVIVPNDKVATLGKVINAMRAPGKWTFIPGTGYSTDIGAVVALLQALWKGQDDRHGGQVDFAEVTQSEAEAAVHLAVQLVRWFATGTITQALAPAVGTP